MKTLQQEIYKLISVNNNVYSDFLPSKDENDIDLDYSKNLYITYSLKNIEDIGDNENSIILELEVISNIENRTYVRDKALELDKILNYVYIDKYDSKIIRSNVWYIPFNDLEDNKALVTLSYKILKF